MSHNIVLSSVRYSDLRLLGDVVNRLSKGAAKLVRHQKTFRTYAGQPNNCEHCITMPGPHDIGLRLNKEGSYDMIFDPFTMDRTFVARGGNDTYSAQGMVGAIAQEYLLSAAEIRAAQSGFTTTRMPAANGSVSLVMERAA